MSIEIYDYEDEAPEGASSLLDQLPAEAQAAAYRRAAQAGVSDREPELMKLLMTLEYYSYLTNRVPDKLDAVASGAAERLDQAGRTAAEGVADAGRTVAGLLDETMAQAADQLRTAVLAAAGKAVGASLKQLDLSPVLNQLAEHTDRARRTRWLSAAVIAASVAIIAVGGGAGYLGWHLATTGDAFVAALRSSAHQYVGRMACSVQGRVATCTGPDGMVWRFGS